ncbi:ATP-binding cassette domain-containing protein [Rhodococcus sp. D2-41]|uniref:ATP-binding cassette domain-containing protein n=1 Tax=Speluncibacter jeojiensis TaxID=2710754 RepID=UPI00240F5F7E|nr:ATP-binding cassette domain-containing protein [Rhodococcus sp. D2-41]MDG3011738.1 ATP-binding cassette domain-containing protein [Rhodococcus sp. D2-41]
MSEWLKIRAQLVERGIDAGFDVSRGEVLALLGPEGAGKSSVLAMIAGTVTPDRGEVTLADAVLFDSAASVDVAVTGRPIALMPQRPVLYTSLTVRENVEYGPRSRGSSATEAARVALEWLGAADMADLVRRRPRKLTAAQARVVALTRAFAEEPRVLLLDDPFGGLEPADVAPVRAALRRLLRRRADAARSTSTVIASAEFVDGLALADRAVVMENGMVVDAGTPTGVLAESRSLFAADLAGTNLLFGTAVEADPARRPALAMRTEAGAQIGGAVAADLGAGDPAVAVFAPRAVTVRRAQDGMPGIPVRVARLQAYGARIRVRGSHDDRRELIAELGPAAARELALEVGAEAVFVVDPDAVEIFPAG